MPARSRPGRMSRSPSSSPPNPIRTALLFVAGVLGKGIDSLEDFLVDDEDQSEHEEREYRGDGQDDKPVAAFLLTSGNPALYRRKPERKQEDTANGELVEALMEDR